ncbi:hypothetical protein [Limimaricola soesokkakensis]|uniref:hypothetical protein n=1 Tax=Limimaricola soesokkakensis TaxID=1343159 RepID=UPI0035196C3B
MKDIYAKGPAGLEETVELAANTASLEAACALIPGKLAQDEGSQAGRVFSDGRVEANWDTMSIEERRHALEDYVAAVRAQAGEDPRP